MIIEGNQCNGGVGLTLKAPRVGRKNVALSVK